MTGGRNKLDRRTFMGATLGAAAGVGLSGLASPVAAQVRRTPGGAADPAIDYRESPSPSNLFRLESDVRHLEVEGQVPSDLNGAFYRVGPDFQYPPDPRTIPFDGEGHVGMFRISNGRVDFRSRFVRNERYMAQDKAGRSLFPVYRNPYFDDPSVEGVSRSTANTHIINHRHMLLALKEDSPPSALDLLTLETLVPSFTFDDQLPSETFTAHPKVDSETGNMVAFGYEARGHGTDDVSVFEITPQGEVIWNAWIKVPYVGMLHDFAVTDRYIVFYVMPMRFDDGQMREGGIHFSYDNSAPTYFGVMRRGGDGSDLQWIEGPSRSSTHVMGAFSDGDRLYVDVEMSESNPFPFMPMSDGSAWNPQKGASRLTRLSANVGRRRARSYGIEVLNDSFFGALPRQDDRYNTKPYSVGFLPTRDADPERPHAAYVRFDHANGKTTVFNAGPNTTLAECCFAPKNANAAEGEGYLMGVATRNDEGGRADLVILDAQHLDQGPVATVRLPTRIAGQVHGWWVPEEQLPDASA